MKIYIRKSAIKDLKKIDDVLRKSLHTTIQKLSEFPMGGEQRGTRCCCSCSRGCCCSDWQHGSSWRCCSSCRREERG